MKQAPPQSQYNLAYFLSLAAQLHRRHPFFFLGTGIVIAAPLLALNWSWFTAIGVSSILLSVLPCAVMCAFGLCMRGDKKCSKDSTSDMRSDGDDGSQ